VGAVAALGLTLVASVRRRRRELALLKTIGFTRRQLLVAVDWQATVVAVLSLVIGTPLGVAFGRLLWLLFAHQLSAVADPAVPVVSVAAVVVGTLLVANLVAALPGRIAARTPAALSLRSE
jgi:ABC-type antimicrobial peptide transport system permease subunit